MNGIGKFAHVGPVKIGIVNDGAALAQAFQNDAVFFRQVVDFGDASEDDILPVQFVDAGHGIVIVNNDTIWVSDDYPVAELIKDREKFSVVQVE